MAINAAVSLPQYEYVMAGLKRVYRRRVDFLGHVDDDAMSDFV